MLTKRKHALQRVYLTTGVEVLSAKLFALVLAVYCAFQSTLQRWNRGYFGLIGVYSRHIGWKIAMPGPIRR